jgi:hypothetical protein
MIRFMHGGIALAVGAGDALVTSKVTGTGPGGIPWAVYFESAAVAAGIFGGKIGIDADVRDPLLLSGLALAGARLTRVAAVGKLMSGPKAWGGEGGDFGSADASLASGGRGIAAIAGRPAVRLLPGRAAVGGSISLYPAQQEMAGVAG